MITFEDIKKANETIVTTDVKGKEYAEVNQRIKAFRIVHPNGSIQTEIVSHSEGVIVFKAIIYDEEKHIIGTGHAQEKEGSTFINKTSYVENCETSAIGRALGMCGFGIDVAIASAEEVQNAMLNQDEKTKKKLWFTNDNKTFPQTQEQTPILAQMNLQQEWLITNLNVGTYQEIDSRNAQILINRWKEKKGIK